MKRFYILVSTFILAVCSAQINNFNNGFKTGFEDGFCYQKPNCLKPLTPLPPLPNINERNTNYKDGYNRGFLAGQSKSQSDSISENQHRTETTAFRPRNRNIDYWDDLDKTQNEIFSYKLKSIENQRANLQAYVTELSRQARAEIEKSTSYQNEGNLENALQPTYQAYRYFVEISKYVNDKTDSYELAGNYLMNYGILQFHINNAKGALRTFKEVDDTYLNYLNRSDLERFYWYYATASYMLNDFQNSLTIANRGLIKFPYNEGLLKNKTANESEINKSRLKNSENTITESNSSEITDLWSKANYAMNSSKIYRDAIYYSTQLISIKNIKNLGSVYFLRAQAYNEIKEFDKSNSDFQYIIKNFMALKFSTMNLGTLYNNVAYNYVLMKKYTIAKPYIDKALIFDQDKWYIWDTKGELEYLTGNYKESLKAMDKAIDLNSKKPSPYFYRGLSNIKLGNKKDGCQDLQFASEFGSDDAYDYIKKNCE